MVRGRSILRNGGSHRVARALSSRKPFAIGHFVTAPMRPCTFFAVTGFVDQIGNRMLITFADVMSLTRRAPILGIAWSSRPARRDVVHCALDPEGRSRHPESGRTALPKGMTPALRGAEFISLVALLMSLGALATNAMLPALPAIGRELGAPRPNDVQFVVTSVFLGLGIGQMLFGPLSDRIGRKAAIHAGLALFMVGCVVSLFATTFQAMIAGRVLQGLGVAGPRVVTMALVRDQYEGARMARLMSMALAVFVLVPTVAPALGQVIVRFSGWRAIFAIFLVIAAISLAWFAVRQPETLPPERRRAFSPSSIGRAVIEIVRIRAALGYTLATGCVFAPFVAYLSTAQQIFQEAYDTGALFPAYFAVLVLAVGGALLVNGRLVMRYGMRRLSAVASALVALVSIIAWAGAFAFDGLPPLWLFMVYIMTVFVCVGFVFGNLSALAMEPLGHLAGAGAAVVSSLATLISLPFGILVGQLFDGTMYALIGAFAVFGTASCAAIRRAGSGARRM